MQHISRFQKLIPISSETTFIIWARLSIPLPLQPYNPRLSQEVDDLSHFFFYQMNIPASLFEIQA